MLRTRLVIIRGPPRLGERGRRTPVPATVIQEQGGEQHPAGHRAAGQRGLQGGADAEHASDEGQREGGHEIRRATPARRRPEPGRRRGAVMVGCTTTVMMTTAGKTPLLSVAHTWQSSWAPNIAQRGQVGRSPSLI